MNQVEFAKYCGCTKGAVNHGKKEGRITLRPDGKIDITHPDNMHFKNSLKPAEERAKFASKKKKKKKVSKRAAKATKKEPEKPISTLDQLEERANEIEDISEIQLPLNLDGLSKASAERLKQVEQIRALQLKRDMERQKLITREAVQHFVAKLYLVDTNEWRTYSDRLVPGLANIFKRDDENMIIEAREYIEAETFKTLSHVKRLMNDFLKMIGAPTLARLKKEMGE